MIAVSSGRTPPDSAERRGDRDIVEAPFARAPAGGRIAIVGGGVAGLVCATHLARRRAAGNVEILLIDRNFAHSWKPMLHTFAAGTANYATQSIPFASHAKRTGFRYWPGNLVGLDRSRKRIELGPMTLPDGKRELPGRTLPYDTLILAIGSRADPFKTPGVAEHCYFVDDIGEAQALNRAVRSRVLQAVNDKVDPTVVIGGGGATGVELAAELTRSVELFSRYNPEGSSPRLDITVIESGPRLLAQFPESVSRDAERKLKSLGINVRTGTRVRAVEEGAVTLSDGQRLDAAVCVWAAGAKAPAVTARLDGLATNGKGQVLIRPTLQSQDDDHVFAIGDCASLSGSAGAAWPTTAQVARQQALHLASSLTEASRAGSPLRVFRYSDRGSLVTLGEYAAYGSLGQFGFFSGAVIKGKLAGVAHSALYRMHVLDLLGPVRGGASWLADGLLRIARPRVGLD